MSVKKVLKQFTDDTTSNAEHPLAIDEQVVEMLRILHQKIVNSPVMNGGFERLVDKVDNIDVKVNSIHDAVYHPDNGLFARVKDVEHAKEKIAGVDRLEKDVLVLQKQREIETTIIEKDAMLSEQHERLVKIHDEKLKDLIEFKSRIYSIVKWGLVTLGGGLLTGIGKLLYDFVQGTIVVH